MTYYVRPNQEGIVIIDVLLSEWESANGPIDNTRHFATLFGASAHPDAPPVTSFEHPVTAEYLYDGEDIIQNNWKIAGLQPCAIKASYKVMRDYIALPIRRLTDDR